VVHTEHAFLYMEEMPRARHLLRAAAHIADTVVLVGAALRPYYTDRVGLPASRLRVVVNGVNTQRFRPVPPEQLRERRAAAGLPADGLVVGAVGRIAPEKNFPLLLRALAAVRARGVAATAVIVGDGGDRPALDALAGDLALGDGVRFLGWRTDVADIVGLFDALAVTSFSEALPLVVLEAMSAGVPVVSTAVGEIPRVLDGGDAGVLVPSDDTAALADAVARLAADPDARRALGAVGRARVEREYSLDAMVDAYVDLYGLPTA
jgi:glycosyltransferase involved in cell wall biosynthesis